MCSKKRIFVLVGWASIPAQSRHQMEQTRESATPPDLECIKRQSKGNQAKLRARIAR